MNADPSLAVDFLIAPPRMALYMKYSTRIYEVYMKYVAPEDIVVYSIDEVFMDITNYLNTYGLTPREFVRKIILDVLETTGITATAGIAPNLFLCKAAMDIAAKHIPADENGVRIAELDEMTFRRELWSHRPLTDFWRVGRGIARKLEDYGMYTMGDVARCSEKNEDLLYQLFGKNAELLIDHAWGWEPCTVEAIKAYRPSSNSTVPDRYFIALTKPTKQGLHYAKWLICSPWIWYCHMNKTSPFCILLFHDIKHPLIDMLRVPESSRKLDFLNYGAFIQERL